MRLVPFALFLTACDGDTDDDVVCTDIFASSTLVTPVDEAGNLLAESNASWRRPGDEDFEPCDANDDGTWTCGWEETGVLEILVDAWGYGETQVSVTVEGDGCHALTELVDVVLDPVECTLEVVPSVLVSLEEEDGTPITAGATVSYDPVDRPDLDPGDCEWSGDSWSCGEEIAGEILITATHPAYVDATQSIIVGEDECHVITESLSLVLAQP